MRAYRADTLSVQRIHAARQAALSIAAIRAARAKPAAAPIAPSAPTVRAIIDFVAHQTGLPVAEIVGQSRERRLFRARAAITWIARAATDRSAAQIGAAIGGRDHTTIVEQRNKGDRMRDSDPAFRLLTDRALRHFSEGKSA